MKFSQIFLENFLLKSYFLRNFSENDISFFSLSEVDSESLSTLRKTIIKRLELKGM
jgi:hypothetical protein